MKRRTKIIFAAICVCFLVGVAGAAVSIFHFWNASGWPQRVPSSSFTTTKPKAQDVAGTYLLKGHSGQPCQLDVDADGSFRVTNYPIWNASASGRWEFVTPGIAYPNPGAAKQFWGIKLSAGDGQVDTLDLTGNAAPYGMVKLYAEADEGAMLTFEKKK